MYNFKAMLNLYKMIKKKWKNISTEQKKTPENSWIQSPYGYSRRT